MQGIDFNLQVVAGAFFGVLLTVLVLSLWYTAKYYRRTKNAKYAIISKRLTIATVVILPILFFLITP